MDTVLTNWSVSNLVENINDIDPNLILIPAGHWLNYYDDYTDLSTALLDYVESGGGVLFVGENNLELSGLYDNVYVQNDWCCGYNESNNEYFDEAINIDGVGDQVDVHRFYSIYIEEDSDYEVVLNNEWWGYEYSHIIVSKAIGGGATTYLGSAFDSWYEDEVSCLQMLLDTLQD